MLIIIIQTSLLIDFHLCRLVLFSDVTRLRSGRVVFREARVTRMIYQSHPPIQSQTPTTSHSLLIARRYTYTMAPKRKSTDAAGDSASKKSKATADNASAAPALPPVPRSKRWSKGVSGSANADMEYRTMMTRNPGSAWEFVCQCRPIADADDDDDEDEDEEDEDEEGEGEGEGEPKKKSDRPPCDHGKTCLCTKPSAEHPEHPYTLTLGGIQKFSTTAILCSLRDPDAFDMYIYNDFYGYGLQEVIGNLLLDFEEVKNDWKQQWFICEAMVVFFHRVELAPLFMYVGFPINPPTSLPVLV